MSASISKHDRVFVAGHNGMVGSAVVRRLQADGFDSLLLRSRSELDLMRQADVEAFFQKEKPDVAVIAAAKVGGIHANDTYPADFMRDNLYIAANCIDAAWRAGTRRLLFLGSTCIYPREAPQPIPEDSLLTAPLEKTNEAYALAKIAGLKMCQYYRKQYGALFHSAMPTNLYGPGDNYHPENSHVLPAFIRRFHEAKEAGAEKVVIWGSGRPLREFLHTDDLAAAVAHLLSIDNPPDWVNVGSGEEVSIRQLAETVARTVGYEGVIETDPSKPDGSPRKLCDISGIRSTGWEPKVSLEQGLGKAYASFLEEKKSGALRG